MPIIFICSMNIQPHDHDLEVPTKVDVQAEIEVPAHIWELAEKRADAANGDRDAYLLDHLMFDYQFIKSD